MNLFSVSSLVLAICSLGLALFILKFGRAKVHQLWVLFNLSIFLWAIGLFFVSLSQNQSIAIGWWRFADVGSIFIPVFFYHTIYTFCNLKKKKTLIFLYGQAFIFLIANLTPLFINSVEIKFGTLYYNKANLFYTIGILCWLTGVFLGHYELILSYKTATAINRQKISYLLFGFLVGFSGGITYFFPMFNVNFYPIGNFTIPLYCFLSTYAILRYQILDIRIVVSNTAIFIAVYALVLGVPFLFGYKYHLWQISTWAMLVLASAGPFILIYLQRRAEDRLLQEQRRYQATLRQASAGMGKIKDLKKLLNMIVSVLTNAVQIEHTLIYIYDEGQKQYVLGAFERKSGHNSFLHNIEEKSSLIEYLLNHKNLVVLEEIKQRAEDSKDLKLVKIAQIISSLEGALVVPVFIDENLTAIILMGQKESGKPYSDDDLAVFSILANQTALAIENARFFEDIKLTQEQLFQAEKMATIGTMADGLSHQINNRFHALGFIAGDALDTIHLNQNEPMSDKMKEIMTELGRALVRVQDNVVQGGEIVRGLLRYTRKGETGFTAVDVDAAFQSGLEMAQFKIKTGDLKIIRDYDAVHIPKIKGNFTQLQEVFFNLIDNGYDAMMQRKNEKKEPDYQPTLTVRVLKEDGFVQIILEDNGIGVKEEDMYKLFTPFFTTKLSSKKGTGLGLYVIKKIVEDNHGGQVDMVSRYMQGTQMKLRFKDCNR